MTLSPLTKKSRAWYWVLWIFSLLLNIGPLCGYAVMGFIQADLTTEKVALTSTILIVFILSAISWMNKTTMRSKIWVIMIGLYFCINHIEEPLFVIGITQIVDEWFIAPLAASFKQKYTINRVIDKRGIT
jgi:hypothetical protein